MGTLLKLAVVMGPLCWFLLCSVLGAAQGAALAVRFEQVWEGGGAGPVVNITQVEVRMLTVPPLLVCPASPNMLRLDGVEPATIVVFVLLFRTGQIVHELTVEETRRLIAARCLTIKYDSRRIYQPARYWRRLSDLLPRCVIV